MDVERFRRIVRAFADDPEDIDLKHGKLLVQVRDEIIEAKLSPSPEGGLMVTENGDRLSALSWVVRRLAKLPQLADRICSHDESPPHFVAPAGDLVGHEEFASDADGVRREDIAAAMADTLGSQIPGTTRVWYLTSDAGEGKTSLINHLAVEQARAYKRKETRWLLVPIPLGGRTFLRFDDVVVAALVNRLRFQLLYYDAFLELVRLGVVVPAFDGFEEMIIEGSSGEAVSALGQLVNNLDSEGSVLVAARKAYFEYLSFLSQARLIDTIIGKNDVTFGRMSLKRWDWKHFVEYGRKRKLNRPEALYEQVAASSLGTEHPLLTRAFLVRRLVDVATEDGSDLSRLLGRIGQPRDYFLEFVSAIVEREAREKWMDKSGEPPRPLLTVDEHHRLLSMVAHEMWLSSTDDLKTDEVDIVAEMFTEEGEKSPAAARQIQERLKQHALLVRTGGDRLGFDHEHFRLFYLGFALGLALAKGDVSAVKAALDVATAPRAAVDHAAARVHREGDSGAALALLQRLATPQLPASFVRENCGALTVALVDGRPGSRAAASHMNFPKDALRGRSLSGLTIRDSHFSATSLEEAALIDCRFVRCRFERLDGAPKELRGTGLDGCDVTSMVDDDVELYAPEQIRRRLASHGFAIEDGSAARSGDRAATGEMSEDLKLVQRALRVFTRATGVTEKTMQTRLGGKFNWFRKEILPRLLDAGVLEELPYEGKGKQRRFGIAVPMRRIADAMKSSGGQLGRFVDAFGTGGAASGGGPS